MRPLTPRHAALGALCTALLLPALLTGSHAAAQDAAVETGSDLRAAEEQVITRVGLGLDFATTGLSGEEDLQGQLYGDDTVRTTTNFVVGEVALGTRGLGLKNLNTYILTTAALDTGGNPAVDAVEDAATTDSSAQPSVFNRYSGAQNVLLHTAYAELDGLSSNPEGALSHVTLRAGRQFHWGMSALTFDGATLGYADGSLDLGVRFGRRAAIYDVSQDDPGLIGGASVAYDFKEKADLPLLVRAEFIHFQREVVLLPIDRAQEGNKERVDVTVDTGELAAYLDVGESGRLNAALSLLGADPSHARLGLTWAFGQSALFLDLDQKVGPDLFYDIAGGPGKTIDDRNTTLETYRLNIPDRQPYSDLRARLELWPTESLSITPSAGYHLVLPESERARTAFDADQASWGLGARYDIRISKAAALALTADYNGLTSTREPSDEPTFFDVASGAESSMHELSGGLEYARGSRFVGSRMLGGRSLVIGVGGFFRSYTLTNRFIPDTAEDYVGGQANVRWEAGKFLALRGVYELARDSSVFTRPFGNFQGIRAGVEGRF